MAMSIFQFTPLREGRRKEGSHDLQEADFNSRPSARGDDGKACTNLLQISILNSPPPRGGPRRKSSNTRWHSYFNSRPSARGDATWATGVSRFTVFQFTPLREGRRSLNRRTAAVPLFQFTPLREGRRLEHARAVVVLINTIHAPPRGATTRAIRAILQSQNFNSRPSARGDTFAG